MMYAEDRLMKPHSYLCECDITEDLPECWNWEISEKIEVILYKTYYLLWYMQHKYGHGLSGDVKQIASSRSEVSTEY